MGLFSFLKKKKSSVVGKLDVFYVRNNNFRMNQERAVRVWLPLDYEDSNEKREVIYMFDGQNLFDKETASYHMEWCIDETLAYFYQNYKIKCPVVVGIDCGKDRMSEYFPPMLNEEEMKVAYKLSEGYVDENCPNLKRQLLGEETFRFLIDDVMPIIEEKYRVRNDRDGRYLGGSSMGGLMTMYGYQHYNEYFSKYIAFSTAFNILSFSVQNEAPYERFKENFVPYENTKIAMCVGGVDFESQFVPYYKDFVEFLKTKGFDETNLFTFENKKEKHNELQWARAFNPAMKFFLKDQFDNIKIEDLDD